MRTIEPTTESTAASPKRNRSGSRRAHGEGTVYKLPNGKGWQAKAMIDGKRHKVNGRTKSEALARLAALKEAPGALSGLPPKPTVGQWLQHWVTEVVPTKVKRQSLDQYRYAIHNYLIPEIDCIRLANLTPEHVEAMLRRLAQPGIRAEGKPRKAFSAPSQQHALKILSVALKVAERRKLVARNVATLVEGPILKRSARQSLTPAQAREVVEASERSTSCVASSGSVARHLHVGGGLPLTRRH